MSEQTLQPEPTIKDVLSAVTVLRDDVTIFREESKKGIDDLAASMNTFATNTENRLQELKKDVSQLKLDVGQLKLDVFDVRGEVATIKNTMVTKDGLKEELANLRDYIAILVHKEDRKVSALAELLHKKQVLSDDDVKYLLSLDPFPRAS